MRDAAKMVRWISRLGPRVQALLGTASLLILLLLIYPLPTTIVPAWDLRVLDETSTPVGAINVTEHWQHYLFESSAHEDLRQTAADGSVSFPERTMRASLLRRVLARMSRIASESRHARLDPAASVVAWGRKDYETTVAVYKSGEPPQSEMIVHSLR